MLIFPHAKINLGLFVKRKREDGFHEIETVFYPVMLKDVLEIITTDGTKSSFFSSGINIPGNRNSNLCIKAYELLKKRYNIPAVNMHLHKVIPTGAGLGGGSSDAAFTLRLLNEMLSLNINKDEMMSLAAQLGSDCAYFIHDEPMLAKGRGEIFSNINLDLSDYHILLIKPDLSISSAEAYSMIRPEEPQASLEEIIKTPVNDWKKFLYNDFEIPIFKKHPYIKEIKEFLYEKRAVYASMSGSGSAVFGLFNEKPNIEAEKIFKDCFCWAGKL
ncbi:MAG: 4-(cytidine 5'-diphospho)-2-C-methyl-D-erythritol kinase [Bacteroidales bacterium]